MCFVFVCGVLWIIVKKIKKCEADYHREQVVPFPQYPIAQGNAQRVNPQSPELPA